MDLCVSAGHACGKAVSVDGSFVAANASPVRRVDGNDVPAAWREAPGAQSHAVQSYLADLDRTAGLAGEEQQDEAPFVPKHTSLTDPQAAWSRIKNVGCFGYKAHFLIDNAHGIILDVEGTDARLSLEIVGRTRHAGTPAGRARHRTGSARRRQKLWHRRVPGLARWAGHRTDGARARPHAPDKRHV